MKTLYSLLIVFLSVSAQAQTIYYVNSLTGNDSNDGLAATMSGDSGPKASISSAVMTSSEGDILSIESGNYSEHVIIDHDLVFVKTGTGQVTASSFTFSFGAELLDASPASAAINAPLVTVNSGSSLQDGITLVATGGTLVLNDGMYGESVFLNKSFDLLVNESAEVDDLILAGQGITVVLDGRLIVRNSLQFNRPEGGKLEISTGFVVVQAGANIYPGNSASYAITSGSGSLRAPLSASGTVFPVGTESIYAPLTISGVDSGSEEVSVAVHPAGNPYSFNPWLPDQVNSNVMLQWDVNSVISQQASLRFDYTGAAEPGDWNEVQNRIVAVSTGGDFTPCSNSMIGESYASADAAPNGLFAVYSDFPNAIEPLTSDISAGAFPNPFISNIRFNIPPSADEVFNVQITDMAGRLVYVSQITGSAGTIAVNGLDNLDKGMYLFTASSDAAVYTARIMKGN
ncbi:MAG: T9SS type A sorting domain-containing protein [Bacteroidia bacterium]